MNYSTKKVVSLIFNLHIRYMGQVNAKEADTITRILVLEMADIDPLFSIKEVDFTAACEMVMKMVKQYVTESAKRMEELRAIGGLTSTKAQKETGIRINSDGGI